MPIPEPTGFDSPDNYKLQLSFDGDRVITPWLQIIGRHAPEAPSLVIDLVRSGDALVSVSAKVEGLKPTDPHYTLIRKEFSSKETWPKHLTVRNTRIFIIVHRCLNLYFISLQAPALLPPTVILLMIFLSNVSM